jgi:hypothetical protein
MFIKRKDVRYPSIAHARIPEIFQGEGLLKDLSVTGCCIEYTVYTDVKCNTPYTIEIIPEKAAKIGKFELTAECRWIHAGGYSCDIGFAITASPKGKLFQRYVDYLTWRSGS